MNERIEELARLAGGKSTYGTLRGPIVPPPPGWFDRTTVDLEKFAKLLIKECALVAALFSIEKNDIHPDIKWDDMSESAKTVNHTTCQQVAQKIKERFGVEE